MTNKLAAAISALRQLPDDAQNAIAVTLLSEVQSMSQSSLTPGQQATVETRLAQPRELASDAEKTALFSKFA